jgi:hypothetical protein
MPAEKSKCASSLEHDPEKAAAGFRKDRAPTNNLDPDPISIGRTKVDRKRRRYAATGKGRVVPAPHARLTANEWINCE